MGEKILTVKEYDKISAQNFPADRKYFKEFVDFAKEFNADENSDDILKFIRLGYRGDIGDFVQMKNYVGLIQLPSGFQIEILPKIYNGDNKSDVKKIFLKMLRSLRQFAGNKLNYADLYTSKMPLYEIFIRMYLEMLLNLIKRGLKSAYTLREDNLNFLKGKLLFNQQIKYNTVHREKFFVAFDEYNLNRPEHRLIKSALLKLQRKSQNSTNRQQIYQMSAEFDFIEASTNFDKDLSAVCIDRQNIEYAQVMHWTEIFLKDESVTAFAGKSTAQALLFPMEKLFEAYVAKCVKEYFTEFKVTVQAKEKYLFDKPQTFRLCPDILLERGGEKFIIDTKWKRLFDNPRENYGISQADMYQMYAYSHRYNVERVILLYPAVEGMEKFFVDNVISYQTDGEADIKIFFIDLIKSAESMTQLKNLINHL